MGKANLNTIYRTKLTQNQIGRIQNSEKAAFWWHGSEFSIARSDSYNQAS